MPGLTFSNELISRDEGRHSLLHGAAIIRHGVLGFFNGFPFKGSLRVAIRFHIGALVIRIGFWGML